MDTRMKTSTLLGYLAAVQVLLDQLEKELSAETEEQPATVCIHPLPERQSLQVMGGKRPSFLCKICAQIISEASHGEVSSSDRAELS